MKLRLLTLLGILLFTSGCYTQYKFVYEIDRSEPTNPSDHYCWECSEKKSKQYNWTETKQTANPNYKNNPWQPSKKTTFTIEYKNYEVYNWYKKNYYVDRKDWFGGYSIWEPSLYSPYYGYRYNQWYSRNVWRYGNHWDFYYWDYHYPKNNFVIINKNDNKKPNKSRRGGFGNNDFSKPTPSRDYFDDMRRTRSGSGTTKITNPRSTGRSTTVNPPTTRTTGRSSTVKSNDGSSNTRSTGRTTTKKKTRTE
jgi:hypothetical protein